MPALDRASPPVIAGLTGNLKKASNPDGKEAFLSVDGSVEASTVIIYIIIVLEST